MTRLTDTNNNLFRWLGDCKDFDLHWIDTSDLTSMKYMFQGINTDLDLSCWDTSNVTDMSYMFYYSNLRSINLNSVNIGKVKTMQSMFEGCSLLTSVDMHNCDKGGNEELDQLTNVSFMFKNCDKLESVDISGLGLNHVITTERMFQYTPQITSINFDGDQFESVKNAYDMFQCPSMKEFDTSKWNMKNIEQAGELFTQCSSLQRLDLTGINIKNLSTRDQWGPGIVVNAKNLEYLNISNWDLSEYNDSSVNIFSNVGSEAKMCEVIADGMIVPNECSFFKSINATSISMKNSDWSHVKSAANMFADCTRLKSLTITNKTNVNLLTTIDNMFLNDSVLEDLDISWMEDTNLTSAEKAFSGATKLIESHKTDLENVLKTTTLTQDQISAAFD